jgi:hypothetical protein
VTGRRRIAALAAVGVVAAGAAVAGGVVALAGATAGSPRAAGARLHSRSTLAHNKRVARSDAAGLLGRLRLPAGAARSPREPTGAGTYLRPMPSLEATSARVTDHAWWTVPEQPSAVLAYLKAHPPAGGRYDGSGSTSSGSGVVALSIDYSWPAIAGVLGGRLLDVTVSAVHGGTGVLAETQSEWIVPRPASEVVPAGVHEIDVSAQAATGGRPVSRQVTAAATVRALVALINGLPIGQPTATSCPAEITTGAQIVALTFRPAAGGAALARASFTDYAGWGGLSGECNEISLSIGGRQQRDGLIGGRYIARLTRILGFSPVDP